VLEISPPEGPEKKHCLYGSYASSWEHYTSPLAMAVLDNAWDKPCKKWSGQNLTSPTTFSGSVKHVFGAA